MTDFDQPILMTGFGVVAQAALPMLLKHLRVPPRRITVVDFADREQVLRPWIRRGLRFVRDRVTPLSLPRLLSTHVGRGGLIIDLAWSIDCFDILAWAHHNEVLYVNASLESWDPVSDMHSKSSLEKSLYARYEKLLPLARQWRDSTTAVIDHGANPGLVSHFLKQGLLDIGARVLGEKATPRSQARRIERWMQERQFAELARELDVKVIHCSEWDTQRASKPKRTDEFVATWSVEGMWEESISPCEVGWGTHEKWLPPYSTRPETGPANQIIVPQMGLNTWVRSWVPHQEIVGMVVTHGESFGISHALTVRKNGQAVYRPTVHYAYMPCNDSIVSLHELRCRNYELHPRKRILTDEITEGMDLVGALIMGHRYQSWWTGSILSIEAARRKVPHVNATAIQVAAGVMAAALWTIQNPRRGICLPEDLPHDELLRHARPYLGRVISQPSDWTPLRRHRVYFYENPQAQPDQSDPWQFTNFLFRP
ncbi:MAG TPA: saccharopine dehydrogenase C-terminal domain-containing protein [Candidatus Paceibacterota bacterium]|nr:homospermidine synthase [Verrucomicrobiota bacterium]HOX03451.1 saccharopine dehydrogenase C-terminal domain-containing protein [Verrucomicrobiota bacterium]HRZ47191.1 saccharopine dehydrogenase C-terminal domain-containing protein [Candidatus Paceibacterota bacterium]